MVVPPDSRLVKRIISSCFALWVPRSFRNFEVTADQKQSIRGDLGIRIIRLGRRLDEYNRPKS